MSLSMLAIAVLAASVSGQPTPSTDKLHENPSRPVGYKLPPLPLATPSNFAQALEQKTKPIIVFLPPPMVPDDPAIAVWSDARVKQWLDEHAIAMQYEIWMNRGRGEVKELNPLWCGVAAFRDGRLVDQDEAPLTADQLLDWLNAVEHGPITEEFARSRAGDRTSASTRASRIALAQRLDRLGKTDAADEEYAWLLESSLTEPRIRRTEIPQSPIQAHDNGAWYLFEQHAPRSWRNRAIRHLRSDPTAQSRLAPKRDELATECEKTPPSLRSLRRWLEVESVAPDPDRVLTWYQRIASDPSFREIGEDAQDLVFTSLCDDDRWIDAAGIMPKPFGYITRYAGMLEMSRQLTRGPLMSAPPDQKAPERNQLVFALQSGALYAALLAANREDEAKLIALAIFQTVDTPDSRGIVLDCVLKAHQVRPEHREWAIIADQEPEGDRLVPLVEAALQAKSK